VSSPAQPEAGGKVAVIEFFSYACPHCYSLEPVMHEWEKTAPEYVEFTLMPAFWNPYFKMLAQAYYTAEVLKISEKINKSLFDAIHLHGRQFKTEGALAAFFEAQGAEKGMFEKTFNSFAVKQKIKLADARFHQFNLKGVPGVIVGGKYFTDVRMAGGRDEVAEVLDFLVRKAKRDNS